MKDVLAGIKLEKHRNVQEVNQRLLVHLEAPAVTDNRRGDKYVPGKLSFFYVPKRVSQVVMHILS